MYLKYRISILVSINRSAVGSLSVNHVNKIEFKKIV